MSIHTHTCTCIHTHTCTCMHHSPYINLYTTTTPAKNTKLLQFLRQKWNFLVCTHTNKTLIPSCISLNTLSLPRIACPYTCIQALHTSRLISTHTHTCTHTPTSHFYDSDSESALWKGATKTGTQVTFMHTHKRTYTHHQGGVTAHSLKKYHTKEHKPRFQKTKFKYVHCTACSGQKNL